MKAKGDMHTASHEHASVLPLPSVPVRGVHVLSIVAPVCSLWITSLPHIGAGTLLASAAPSTIMACMQAASFMCGCAHTGTQQPATCVRPLLRICGGDVWSHAWTQGRNQVAGLAHTKVRASCCCCRWISLLNQVVCLQWQVARRGAGATEVTTVVSLFVRRHLHDCWSWYRPGTVTGCHPSTGGLLQQVF